MDSAKNRYHGITKAAILVASCIGLIVAFPNQQFATMVVLAAFLLEPITDPAFRPFLWAFIGSVIAYLAMTIAFYVRQFAFTYHTTEFQEPLQFGHLILRLVSMVAPLLSLAKFYGLGSHRLMFATLCTSFAGSMGYLSCNRSTDWYRDLWTEYSSVTWGCCVGAVLSALIVGVYEAVETIRRAHDASQ